MTKEEYLSAKNQLFKEFERKQRELDIKYALSNNDIEIGDIVSDNINTIKVEKIHVDTPWRGNMPRAYYEGIRLTKQLKPFKNGDKIYIHNVMKRIRKDNN